MEANSSGLARLCKTFGNKSIASFEAYQRLVIVDIGHRWVNVTIHKNSGLCLYSRSIMSRENTDTGTGAAETIDNETIEAIGAAIIKTVVSLPKNSPFQKLKQKNPVEKITTVYSRSNKKCSRFCL